MARVQRKAEALLVKIEYICRRQNKCQGFFFTKKVTPIIDVFPSANFPKEKYFSPSNKFFPKISIFPTLIQSIVMRFSEKTHSQPERLAAKLAKMHVTNVLVV